MLLDYTFYLPFCSCWCTTWLCCQCCHVDCSSIAEGVHGWRCGWKDWTLLPAVAHWRLSWILLYAVCYYMLPGVIHWILIGVWYMHEHQCHSCLPSVAHSAETCAVCLGYRSSVFTGMYGWCVTKHWLLVVEELRSTRGDKQAGCLSYP